MPATLLSRIVPRGRREGTRFRRLLLVVFFVTFYLLAFGYHLIVFSSGTPPTTGIELLYTLIIAGCYGTLWLLLSKRLSERHAPPPKIFWTTLLLGLLLIGLAFMIAQVARPPDLQATSLGFDIYTGVPLTIVAVVKMNLLSLLEAAFVCILLLRFRNLVLFKRSKSSQRNWYLMLGFMLLASLVTATWSPAEEPSQWQEILQVCCTIPAVAFMVVNSFRLSWIVQLSFRAKMSCIGLSLLLLVMLATGLGVGGESLLPGASAYLDYYSVPLSRFTTLSVVFGILYCTTAFLSLLFHLPTTSDFQRKADEMAAMHSLTHLVGQVFDSEKLVSTITALPVEAGAGHAAWLAVADPESGSLRPRLVATHNIAPSLVSETVALEAFYDDVLATHKLILLDEATTDHRVDAKPGDGLGSLLVMPLVARDVLLGALFVTKEVTHGFEKDDIEAISVFAAQAALALDNARLFEEKLEKERLAQELAIAREVQHKLLPQKLPSLEGVTIAASSISAQEVGGDYYDFAHIDDRRMAFIVADVSGKGTSAAFYMAEMQGVFQAVSHLAPDPREFLTHANRTLANLLEKNVFISVIYGLLDLDREQLMLARAGHCPAAMINLHGEARLLRSQGLGLGLDRGTLFGRTLDVECIVLQPGDVFVLYTDGVVESRSAEGEEYGYERLLHALRVHRHEDAPDLHSALLDDLSTFIGPTSQYDDDLTLLVLKWHGINLPRGKTPTASSREKVPAGQVLLE